MTKTRAIPALCILITMCAQVRASTTATWEMNGYRDFLPGRFDGVLLSQEGHLALAPKLDTLFASGQPIVWSVAQAPDGTIYAGTGHRGSVYRISLSGKSSLEWTADQSEIFALAVDAKGVLYAATSPDGKIYRIENGHAGEYFAPGVKYIWSLAFSPDGALYAGTGTDGKIYRIESAGKGQVYYETGQAHVTCLAFDRNGNLLAGSEPNGIIYRIAGQGKAFALYDASLPEIRRLVPMPDGSVIAAAMGGSLARRTLGGVPSQLGVPGSVSVSATSTSVTVEAQAGVEIKPKPEAEKAPAAQTAIAAASQVQMIETPGVEKSAIYRINPDNTVETLWSSKDENVYDVLVADGGPGEGGSFSGGRVFPNKRLIFSTDQQGRIYSLDSRGTATLLAQTNEGEAIRLLAGRSGMLVATGDAGKLYRLASQPGASGSYESPVHDAGGVARWGKLSWRGGRVDGGRVRFRTRTGNSLRPDNTWSDWSEPLTIPGGSPVGSPNARYIQWKAEIGADAASLDGVTLAYLPQNTPPVIRSITASSVAAFAGAAKTAAQSQSASAAYSITVTDSGDAGPTPSAGTPTQNLTRPGSDQIQIAWQAEDADGDRLVYALYFRGENEHEWKLLKANLTENSYTLDSDAFADGKYCFKVTASDSPSNPPETARQAELVSAPVLIDRTPPVVTIGTPKRDGSRVEIAVDAVDAASALRRCEYSLDAGPWIPMSPVEGIVDSPRESFVVKLDNLPPGEHLFVVRAVDSANNAGLAKTVVR